MAKLRTPFDKTLKLEKRLATVRLVVIMLVLSPLAALLQGVVTLVVFIIWWVTGIELPIGFLTLATFFAWLGAGAYLAFYNTRAAEKARNGQNDNESLVYALGARDVSTREQDRLQSVLDDLLERGHSNVKVHDNWWVIDYPIPQAFTIGTDLFITREAITGNHLAAILGHELGHLNYNDGRLFKAVRSFVYPFIQFKTANLNTYARFHTEAPAKTQYEAVKIFDVELKTALWAIVFGGFSIIYYAKDWAEHFRELDFHADDFAVKLGLAGELVDYLEEVQKTDMAVPFYASWIPYTELRIDKLLQNPAFERSYAHFSS